MAEEAITVVQASHLLGVSTQRVGQLITEGKLPKAETADGRHLVPKAAVLARKRAMAKRNAGLPTTAVFKKAVAK